MNEERDLANELAAANGISEETLREFRRQQARGLVATERRKTARARFIAIGAWATTLIVVFGSMWVAVVVLLGLGDAGAPPRAILLGLTLLSMLGVTAFVVAVVSSVMWYFSARTASLSAIETRLSDLEGILRAEADRAGGS